MTTDIQVMCEKICELGRSLNESKLADDTCGVVDRIDGAVCILLKTSFLSALAPEAPGLAARTASLKEEIAR